MSRASDVAKVIGSGSAATEATRRAIMAIAVFIIFIILSSIVLEWPVRMRI
jgi:hypothetical protein